MNITFDTSGLYALRAKIEAARTALPGLLEESVQMAGEWVVTNLKDGCPVGANEGPPPPGDGDGRLNESFYVQQEESAFDPGAAVTVRTTQPLKLKFVTEGRGEVLPVEKKALFWPGLPHPVRRAGPSKPNSFVEDALQSAPSDEEVLAVAVEELVAILES